MFSCIPPLLPSFTCMSTSQICFVGLIWNRLSGTAGDSSALRGFTALRGGAPGMGPLQSRGVRATMGVKPLTRELFHYGDTRRVRRPHTRGHWGNQRDQNEQHWAGFLKRKCRGKSEKLKKSKAASFIQITNKNRSSFMCTALTHIVTIAQCTDCSQMLR